MSIAHGIGEGVGAYRGPGRRVGVAAVAVLRDDAEPGRADGGNAQRESIDRGCGTEQVDRQRYVFVRAQREVIGNRRYGVDGDRDRTRCTRLAVANGIGERIGAYRRLLRRIGVGAIAVFGHHAELGRTNGGNGQGQAIHRGIGCQQVDVDRCILVGREGDIARYRYGGDRIDGNGDCARCCGLAIAHSIGEGIGAYRVAVRRVGVAAVAVGGDYAQPGCANSRDGQGQTIDGGVGTQQVQAGGGIFVGAEREVARCWRDGIDGDRDRAGGARLAVADRVSEGLGADGRLVGRIGIRAVAVGRYGAEFRRADGGDGQRQAIHSGIGAQQVQRQRTVFIRAESQVACYWRHGVDRDRDRAGRRGLSIAHGIGEGVGAYRGLVRRVGVGAVAVGGHHTGLRCTDRSNGQRQAVDRGISAKQVQRQRRIFTRAQTEIARHRRYGIDGNRDGASSARLPVADGIGEGVGTHRGLVRRVGVGAIAIGGHHTGFRCTDRSNGKRQAVNRGRCTLQVERQRCVLVRAEDQAIGNRRYGVDRDRDLAGGGGLPVADRVGKGVSAYGCLVGRVGIRAIATLADGAKLRRANGTDGQGQAVDRRCSTQQIQRDRSIFVRAEVQVAGYWWHGVDRDRDHAGRRGLAVADRVGEGLGANGGGVRGVGVGAIAVGRDHTKRRCTDGGDAERQAIDRGGRTQQVQGQ